MGTGCLSTLNRIKLKPSFIILGGNLDGHLNKFVLIFDLERCTLKRALKIPCNNDEIPLADFAASCTEDGMLYLTGGRYGKFGEVEDIWLIDVKTSTEHSGKPLVIEPTTSPINILQRHHSSCLFQPNQQLVEPTSEEDGGRNYLFIVGDNRKKTTKTKKNKNKNNNVDDMESSAHYETESGASRLDLTQLKWHHLPHFPQNYQPIKVHDAFLSQEFLYVLFESYVTLERNRNLLGNVLRYPIKEGLCGKWLETNWKLPVGRLEKINETWFVLRDRSELKSKLFSFHPNIGREEVNELYSLENCCAMRKYNNYLLLLTENKLYKYDIMGEKLESCANLPFIFDGDNVSLFVTNCY